MINTSSFSTVSLEGHTAPVLSVDLDSSGQTVVSSSCDGSVRIWSTETKKQVIRVRTSTALWNTSIIAFLYYWNGVTY